MLRFLASRLTTWGRPRSARHGALTTFGSTIIQRVGNGKQVVPGHPHLELTRYLGTPQVRSDLDWLSPYTRSTRLIGREREMQELQALLADPRPILARVLTGAGGRGKTRLALELCEWASKHGWNAGFAEYTEMSRFLGQQSLSAWGWRRPTLIVIDYAAQHSQALAAWVAELARRRQTRTKRLRLLLLERHASMQAGWCARVFARGGFGDSSTTALLDPREPVELSPLHVDEHCRALIRELLGKIAPGEQDGLSCEPALLQTVRSSHWGGDPLYLMMAALSSSQADGARMPLQRTDLALDLARREAQRIRELAAAHSSQGHSVDPDLAIHLVACVTLAQGMQGDELKACVAAEAQAMGRAAGGDPAVLADLLQQALPRRAGIAPLVPDLIGEAFVLSQDENMGQETLLRCYSMRTTVLRTAIRCAQDFAPQRTEPLRWLEALFERIADDEQALADMLAALPTESVALADISLRVAQRLVLLRHSRSDLPSELHAETLTYLALAYRNTGQQEPALHAAQEAAALYRDLTAQRPEVSPGLARALHTLALMSSELDMREPALQAGQEATALYRELAARRADVFSPELARSLGNLATLLRELGQHEPALQAAQEAAECHRKLAAQRADVFAPELARSLGNLATLLRELGQHEPALQAAQEAAERYRELAAQRPFAFRPDRARALHSLALMLRELDQRENALKVSEEAAGLYRELAAQRMDVFRPNLAGALQHLALLLRELRQGENALAVAQEAAELYRDLAMRRPDVFRSDRARSLETLGSLLHELGQGEPALEVTEEAVRLYRDLAAQHPDVFGPELAASLQKLAISLHALGECEPALAAAQEAADLYRELAARRPDVFQPELATSLHNLALTLRELGQRDSCPKKSQKTNRHAPTICAKRE